MPLLSLRLLLVILVVCGSAARAAVPVIGTPSATAGANGTETLSANVTTGGKDTTVTFSYGLTTTYSASKTLVISGSTANQTAMVSLDGLIGGQTYNYQVKAANSDGNAVASANQTFVVAAYLPTLTLLPPTHSSGTQTVHATVTSNGSTGNVFFQYGTTVSYGNNSTATPIAAGDINRAIDFAIPDPQLTYHYRLAYDDGGGGSLEETTVDDLTNDPPVAAADTVKVTSSEPITISVLTNDTDANGDALKITFVSAPKNGTATFSDTEITYTPGPNFTTTDTFTYTIDDGFGGISSATVTVQALVGSLAGTHGGLVKRANGKEVGYFTLTATSQGGFSGIVMIDGKRYMLSGAFAPDGSYSGFAYGKDGMIPVNFSTVAGDETSTLTATFEGGAYTASLSFADTEADTREGLFGRYTVGLGSGSTTTTTTGTSSTDNSTTTTTTETANTPAGTGWAAVRVRQDGTAQIKGRLPDGRSFSTRGTVDIIDGVATLSFYDDPEDTRVVGSLTLGDTVSGTIQTDRSSSGEGRFPRGYDLSEAASGAKYTPPENGKRTLDTTSGKGEDLTIDFSGGGLSDSVSREIVLDDRDRARVINPGSENLKLHIDRKSGRFQAKITVGDEGKQIKATGVLIQSTSDGGSGRGVGIFNTSVNTGTVTISGGGSTSATTSTATPTTDDSSVLTPTATQ